jgi:UDP-N-acetylmuramoyl-tripeptide--D-alanyl-D-alanine ligase
MNPNRAEFSTRDLVRLFGEDALITVDSTWSSCGVSTDTRSIEPGNLFIALCGETNNGHHYLATALERGAAGAIVQSDAGEWYSPFIGKLPLIAVENTLTALGQLASLHRHRFTIPVVAVAGSAGKTSTKEMTADVLARRYTVLRTEGNKNNQIGAPLTLLGLTADHTAAVIEIGTNEPGEIAILSELVAPTHGVITNIGKEHLEKLIDLDGVEREETTLFAYLFAHRGTAFVNMDDERLRDYLRQSHCISYGISHPATITANVELDNAVRPQMQLTIGETTMEVQLQATGLASASNALAAAAAGHALGLSLDEIKVGLEAFRPASHTGYGRMVALSVNGYTLLNDCYNANPTSMYAALETLQAMQSSGKKIAVLGDMRELGEAAAQEHLDLIRRAVLHDRFPVIMLTGPEMKQAVEEFRREYDDHATLHFYDSNSDCTDALRSIVSEGDVVLIKGSRGIKMEEIVQALQQ